MSVRTDSMSCEWHHDKQGVDERGGLKYLQGANQDGLARKRQILLGHIAVHPVSRSGCRDDGHRPHGFPSVDFRGVSVSLKEKPGILWPPGLFTDAGYKASMV